MKKKRFKSWDRWMAAVTFAEAGEAATAKEILKPADQARPFKKARKHLEKRRAERPALRV